MHNVQKGTELETEQSNKYICLKYTEAYQINKYA